MIKMRFSLRSPLYKATFALGCCLCMAVYLRTALRPYLASRLADGPDTTNLAKAIQYEPSNAEYYDALGRTLVLSVENTDDAIANFRRAVQINPNVASYWL